MSAALTKGEIVIFEAEDGSIYTEVRLEAETLWLTQRKMAELFDKDSDTIGLHLKNIYAEGELEEPATTEFFSVVQREGSRNVTRKIKHYNLDAILSVGYRVSSKRGTQFRIWANRILKEHLVQGYTLNQKRLQEKQEQFAKLKNAIAAALFLYFLERNGLLFSPSGERRISDEGLAALTLLIAISKSEEKETMIHIVITILNRSQV